MHEVPRPSVLRVMELVASDQRRTNALKLALRVLEVEHPRLWKDAARLGLLAPSGPVPFTVRVAFRVHQVREAGLGGTACLGEFDFAQPWFVVAARSQALLLLFSRSGALWLAGRLLARGIHWEDLDSRNWF